MQSEPVSNNRPISNANHGQRALVGKSRGLAAIRSGLWEPLLVQIGGTAFVC